MAHLSLNIAFWFDANEQSLVDRLTQILRDLNAASKKSDGDNVVRDSVPCGKMPINSERDVHNASGVSEVGRSIEKNYRGAVGVQHSEAFVFDPDRVGLGSNRFPGH